MKNLQSASAKFNRLGVQNLSDTELLELIIRTGGDPQRVAEEALAQYGTLTELRSATVPELTLIKGVGPETAKALSACLELGARMAKERMPESPRLSTPEEVAQVLREEVRGLDREVFFVLMLDTKNRLVATPQRVSVGTLNTCLMHPREVFKPAIRHSCASIVLAHNHPSGDPSPSSQDIKITKKLIEAGKILGIEVLDHVIMGREMREGMSDFLSLRESGLVEF